MSTQTMIAWYYVFVGVVLLAGQQYFLTNAHKEAVTKLTASYELKLKEAGMPAAAAIVSQAAPAPASAPATAAPAPATVAAAPASAPAATVASAPVEKASDESALKTIFASAAKPKAKSLPSVPVKVAFRSEPFSKGKILLVTNTSTKAQAYTLNVVRPSTGEKDSFQVKVPPAAEQRFAGEGDWAFKQGDQLQIAASGFAPKSVAIP